MSRHFRPALLALACTIGLASLGSPLPSAAQEKKDEKKDTKPDVTKQKEAAAANMKKAGLAKTTIVETENFFIVGTLAEEKAKALGAVLEKVVPVARKALQYEEKDEPWKGKLAIYYLPETRE